MREQTQFSEPKPRWYRFRLQTICLAVITLGFLGTVVLLLLPNRQLEAVAAIEAKGGSVGGQGNPVYLRHLRRAAGYYSRVGLVIIRSNESAQYLDAFPALWHLSLDGPEITDKAIDSIKKFPELSNVMFYNTSITGSNLQELLSLPKLNTLQITTVKISRELVFALSKLKNPPHIHLSVGGIDDEDLKQLRKLPIYSLWADNPKITDDGMASLEDYSVLEYLDLAHAQISDEGLKHLARLSNLKQIDLTGNDITDDGLNAFDAFNQLNQIVLSGTKVTAKGIADFQKKHRNTKISP